MPSTVGWALRALVMIAGGVGLLAGASGTAEAHERRAVGAFQFSVGFMVEPAYEGQKNGVDLRVTSDGQPVVDVEKTLHVEIMHVESNQKRTQPLRTIFNDPGHYTSDVLPTATGVVRLRFFGTIGGAAIDETFESGPGRFGSIEPSVDLQFPVRVATAREVEAGVRGATEAAAEAESAANAARRLALAGLVTGVLGVAGGGALLASRRR